MQVDFSPGDGRLHFFDPELPGLAIEGSLVWVSYREQGGRKVQLRLGGEQSKVSEQTLSDIHGQGRQLVIHDPPTNTGIGLTLRINTYDARPFIQLQLSISNLSPQPVFLDEFRLLHADPHSQGKLLVPGGTGGLRFFKTGWVGWSYSGVRTAHQRNSRRFSDLLGAQSYLNPATPRTYRRGEFWSEGWGILAGSEAAIVTGLASTKSQFGQVHAVVQEGRQAVSLVTQADGVRLDPGEVRDSEWGYLQFIRLPHPEPVGEYVEAVARQMGARLPATPPHLTWTHWYQFYHDISEDIFINNLEALAEQRSILPCLVVELDDGYQRAWGDWTNTNERFPHGLSLLANRIRETGMTPGLWLAPFTVEPRSSICREHPDWLVKDRRGKPLKAGFVYNMFVNALDTSHPAVLEHIRQLCQTVAREWGFEMLKIDFINSAALPGRRHNSKLTRAESLRLGLEAIREGAGEETFLLGCGCPFGPAIGIVDAMRIGSDTAPSWEPYFHWLRWAGKLIRNEPSPPALRNALRNTLNLSTLHQRWWWNDPDSLIVRDRNTRLTTEEVQSAVTVVGLSGGMVMVSDDLRMINPERLRWVSLLTPNLGLRGLPLDWLEHDMPAVYQEKLQRGSEQWQVVGLFNWEQQSRNVSLSLLDLGYPEGAELHVFNFWKRTHWRTTDATLTFDDVPPHGCRLVRICQVGEGPQVVGDTLHISGGAEFTRSVIEDNFWVLETVDMERRVSGELWLSLPVRPGVVTCNGEVVEVQEMGKGVYRLTISFVGVGRIEVRWLG